VRFDGGRKPKALVMFIAVTEGWRRLRECLSGWQIENGLSSLGPNHLKEILYNPAISEQWLVDRLKIEAVIKIPDGVTGGVNPGDRRALYFLACGLGVRSILEIGTHVGASTAHLAAALLRAPSAERLITVDVVDVNDGERPYWRVAGLPQSPRECVRALGAERLVQFVRENSLQFLDRTNDTFDLIFLDGDHSQDTVHREIPMALAKLRRGGCVILHDFFPGNRALWQNSEPISGPFLAVERLRREGLQVMALPFGELPWPTKDCSNVTSLAALVRAIRRESCS
jgi:predicted O-methyltransferase YrrM